MDLLLFVLLFALTGFGLTVYAVKSAVLKPWQVWLAFGWKIALAAAYGYLFQQFYQGDDTWALQQRIEEESKLLRENPAAFFSEFSPKGYFDSEDFIADLGNYVWNIELWLIVKPLAIFGSFLKTGYYHNIIVINTLFFFGLIWLFRLFTKIYPQHRPVFFWLIFFFPPAVFWLSGLRSDGYLFFSVCGLLFYFDRWLSRPQLRHLFAASLFFLSVMIFRPQVSFLLVPALLGWALGVKTNWSAWRSFGTVYGIALLIVALSSLLPGQFNLLGWVAKKQAAFQLLEGNTRLFLPELKSNLSSFLSLAPRAFSNSFFRPFLWEAKGVLQFISALENILMLVLLLLAIRISIKKGLAAGSFMLSLLFFSATCYLFIGYTVPFPGAILRYRIIAEFLLILCLVPLLFRQQTH